MSLYSERLAKRESDVTAASAALDREKESSAALASALEAVKLLEARVAALEDSQALQAGLAGAMVQVLDSTSTNITAASLNAAAAGTLQAVFTCRLRTTSTAVGLTHEWCHLTPVLTPAENCTDAQIGAPTIVGTPKYEKGLLTVRVTFDTDANATKTYQAGDSVSIAVAVSAGNTYLGFTVAAVTKTYAVT